MDRTLWGIDVKRRAGGRLLFLTWLTPAEVHRIDDRLDDLERAKKILGFNAFTVDEQTDLTPTVGPDGVLAVLATLD